MRTTYKLFVDNTCLEVIRMNRLYISFWNSWLGSLHSTDSLGYGTWGDICMQVYLLIKLVGAIFLSCHFHFHMDTHPIKNCLGHFWRKSGYYFHFKANSCMFFSVRCLIQVNTGHKLLKFGENLQGHGETRYDHEEGSSQSCVHILNWYVF